eukprot:3759280-Alexandrium_andersonii.AAC.1
MPYVGLKLEGRRGPSESSTDADYAVEHVQGAEFQPRHHPSLVLGRLEATHALQRRSLLRAERRLRSNDR